MKYCLKCGKLIPDNTIRDYCHICYEVYEKLFDKIRDYLDKYPNATAFEVSDFTGVDIKVIKNFVKEGRLIEIETDNVNISCKRCGKLLLSKYHEYCPKCKADMLKDLNNARTHFIKKENAKMHMERYSK